MCSEGKSYDRNKDIEYQDKWIYARTKNKIFKKRIKNNVFNEYSAV